MGPLEDLPRIHPPSVLSSALLRGQRHEHAVLDLAAAEVAYQDAGRACAGQADCC